MITRLGAALEDTVELERLLPRMAATLEQGLVLRWARVRLDPVSRDDEEPALSVPIVLGDERLGVVECGPKKSGAFTADDEALVTTLARQAALAVRNVRLTAELEQSRVRLVRAQEAERRRIERNIHDGVQQDLVALIAHAGHTRSLLARDAAAGDRALTELQEGLRRVNTELRELAHGIHPSVLGDRGLLEAVEALAARLSRCRCAPIRPCAVSGSPKRSRAPAILRSPRRWRTSASMRRRRVRRCAWRGRTGRLRSRSATTGWGSARGAPRARGWQTWRSGCPHSADASTWRVDPGRARR